METANVGFGPGTLYINGVKTDSINISSFECNLDETYETHKEQIFPIKCIDEARLTYTITMNENAFYKLTGLYSWVYENCPNRRVSHLMYYGKSNRVRWKNFYRGLRMIGEILRKEK